MNRYKKSPDEQVALLVSLLENSSDLIIHLDRQGTILYINRVALGFRYEDIVGSNWLSYIAKDQQKMMKEYFQKTLKTGDNAECEVFGQGDYGNSFWYLTRFYPLRKGGGIDGVVLVSRDITEQKQMQSKLELQQNQVLNFFKQAPALICMLSGKDFTYQMVNQEYQRMIGSREILGKPLRKALPHFDEEVFTALKRVYETNQPFLGKDVLVTADWKGGDQPEQRYFTFLFQPVTNSAGTVESIWVLGIDVTESKRMEASIHLNDRLVALGTLVAGIGHEINNPLAYSILNLDILHSELVEILGPNDQAKIDLLTQKIDIVHKGLQRVAGIVKSLKTFSHSAEAAEVSEIELHESIENALEIGGNIISHPTRGFKLLTQIPGVPHELLQAVIQHHEECNGNGFPRHLKRDQISPLSRLVSVADAFCKIAIKNPDSPGYPLHVAFGKIDTVFSKKLDMEFLKGLSKAIGK